MKSLAELQAIRDRMKDKVVLREGTNDIRVVVGMATCGIAAGARPVLNALVEEVNAQGLADRVTVSQTGCIGICQFEPVVEVFEAGKEKVGKKGVVRDPDVHREVVKKIISFSESIGFEVEGLTFSPIKGPEGNIEYLMLLKNRESAGVRFDEAGIGRVVDDAHKTLD